MSTIVYRILAARAGEPCQGGNAAALSHYLSGVNDVRKGHYRPSFLRGWQMKHVYEVKVYYADTDSYGVVWHGAYIKWFEQGRVEFSNMVGIEFEELDKLNISLPVVDMNVRYKSPARFNDILIVETELQEIKHTRILFNTTIKDKKTDVVFVNSTVTIVPVDQNGRLLRKIPDYLLEKYSKVL